MSNQLNVIGVDYGTPTSEVMTLNMLAAARTITLPMYTIDKCHPLPTREKLLGIFGQQWRFCYYYPMPQGDVWGVHDGEGGLMETPPPDYWTFLPSAKIE